MKAPFPWFGGKRRVAGVVWDRFGDVPNYCEPFFGSGAVLLERPHEPRCETINDLDCYVANFWRAMQAAPRQLAHHADWPVNEADLHARHGWLANRRAFRERMKTDPHYFDVKIAGWWVWGLSMWIGGGWCGESSQFKRKPILRRGGVGVNRAHWRKRPIIKRGGVGVQRRRQVLKRGQGIHRETHQQKPDLGGDAGAYGRGVHACRLDNLTEYFESLGARLRRVRVCCGDWTRILGYSPTEAVGVTGVFLDPPYSSETGRDPEIYSAEDLTVAHKVREWAIANGDNPMLRIAFCGYAGEHEMPGSWAVHEWVTNGGYANQGADTPGKKNSRRERIWFSPHCLKPSQQELFLAAMTDKRGLSGES
jgi:hypothetical protein